MLEVDDMLDLFWWTPCPDGFEVGSWREACAEVAEALGEDITPLHYEDVRRLVEETTWRAEALRYGHRCLRCVDKTDGTICLRCGNRSGQAT